MCFVTMTRILTLGDGKSQCLNIRVFILHMLFGSCAQWILSSLEALREGHTSRCIWCNRWLGNAKIKPECALFCVLFCENSQLLSIQVQKHWSRLMLTNTMDNSVIELHEMSLPTCLQRRLSDNSVIFSIQLNKFLCNWALPHFTWAQNRFLKIICSASMTNSGPKSSS